MNNLTFDDLRWLHLLWAVLAVALLGIYGIWQRRRALRRFASIGLLPRLGPSVSWARGIVRLTLITLALCALVAAIVGPRWGQAEQEITRRNIDVMVVLDVSKSMLARDIAPSRLDRAKISIEDDLLPHLGGDRIGLITFAGTASLACPLTTDYGFFRLALADVGIDSVARGGTLIGDAIRRAAGSFRGGLDTHKIILLITDGEDHESFPVEAATGIWKDHEIPIVAIALGDEREGARIPIENPRGANYMTHEGEVVWTKANFDDLRRIAAVSELNAFVPVGTRDFDLGEIYRDRIVPAIDYKERKSIERAPLPARYHVFALVALGLLIIDSFLRDGGRTRAAQTAARKSGVAA